ncbi:hypothetical protein DVH24_039169 [Malus domestica]|uniref:Uncharacterized protein n=1 Tax=Malus domestica TaxID=3750 RepID=A0A498KGK0_MALDO|nr:hypothetical protein DVH24_039169 [Malus domestica]
MRDRDPTLSTAPSKFQIPNSNSSEQRLKRIEGKLTEGLTSLTPLIDGSRVCFYGESLFSSIKFCYELMRSSFG